MNKVIQPGRYGLFWSYALAPVAIVLGLAVWANRFVADAVSHNPILNLTILVIIAGGVAIAVAALIRFQAEARGIGRLLAVEAAEGVGAAVDLVRASPADGAVAAALRVVLAPQTPPSIARVTEALRELEQGLEARLRFPGFLSGFMIALGLFGTFIGLLETLQSTGALIANFGTQTTDTSAAVGRLVKGMQGPLGGMATSFSASLFGLLGSLVIGAMLIALQTLAHRIVQDVRTLIALARADLEEPANPADTEAVVAGLARGMDQLMQQQLLAMDLFHKSREADLVTARTLQGIAAAMVAHQDRTERVIDAQVTLNRTLEAQLAHADRLAGSIVAQTDAVVTIKRSQDLLIRVTDQVAATVAEVARIAGEMEVGQRRVLSTERRSSELLASLASGIDTLAARDASLADLQRAAVDSVRNAALIGQRLGETTATFANVRDTLTDAVETGLVRLGEIQSMQAAQQSELVRGLNDLLSTLEFKDRDVVALLRAQSVDFSRVREDLAMIAGRLGERPVSTDAVERLARDLMSSPADLPKTPGTGPASDPEA